jgi:hypothetical protein
MQAPLLRLVVYFQTAVSLESAELADDNGAFPISFGRIPGGLING